jgi:hypothetical protein
VSKKVLRLKIKDIEWSFHGQTNASYIRRHGKDSGAITYTDDREVYFNLSQFRPYFVRHELLHVYIASSSSNASSLNKDQVEELCAELYGDHGPEMRLIEDKILEFFMK